jgi:predicted nucleotidyltransferase
MASARDAILQRLRGELPELRREFPIRRIALFGSIARDEIKDESDVDILTDVDPSIGLRFVTLAERLEGVIGRKVDLVSRRGLKPELWRLIEPELIDV